jgi:tetratricopeptide (TPR) repeat protein
MRDPLCTEVTPYEVLGVDRDATGDDIKAAFKNAVVARPRRAMEARNARDILLDPDKRAFADAFSYDERVLRLLLPSPLREPDCLAHERREQTLAAWEEALCRNPGDAGVMHTLAIAWYWTAIDCDQALALPAADALHLEMIRAWRRVVAFWVACTHSQASVSGLGSGSGETGTRVLAEISGRLHDNWREHNEHGNHDLAEAYRQLELDLETEKHSASVLAGSSVRLSGSASELACGKMMLELLGLSEAVTGTVRRELENRPDNSRLIALRDSLSPYSAIELLVARHNYDQALAEADALSAKERKSSIVIELEARARLGKGKEQASLGDTLGALETWKSALAGAKAAKSDRLAEAIVQTVIRTSKEKAVALQVNRLDQAVEILTAALKIVSDSDLKATAATLLCQRGISRVNSGMSGKEVAGVVGGTAGAVRAGTQDLRAAAKLNPSSSHIKEQLAEAELTLGLVEQLGGNIPAQSAVEEDPIAAVAAASAEAAESRNDLDSAISILEDALTHVSEPAAGGLRRRLSHFYANRGINFANQGVEIANRLTPSDNKMRAWIAGERFVGAGGLLPNDDLRRLLNASSPYGISICAICEAVITGRSFTCQLGGGGGSVDLCERCANKAQAEDKAKKEEAGRLLCAGQTDLEDAVALDPLNAHAKLNYEKVKSLVSDVGLTYKRTRPTRGRGSRAAKALTVVKSTRATASKPNPSGLPKSTQRSPKDAQGEADKGRRARRRVSLAVFGAVCAAALAFPFLSGAFHGAESVSGERPASQATALQTGQPKAWNLSTPESAVRSYLDWTAYAYRMSDAKSAAHTMGPDELQRVDSFVQLNLNKGQVLDQTLESISFGAAHVSKASARLPAQETWRYRYVSYEDTSKTVSGPFVTRYNTTYTVVKAKSGGWVVQSVKAVALDPVH